MNSPKRESIKLTPEEAKSSLRAPFWNEEQEINKKTPFMKEIEELCKEVDFEKKKKSQS